MIQRLGTVEHAAKELLEDLEEVQDHYNSIESSKMLSRTQLIAGVSGMAVTALLSAIGIVIGLWK
jgi:hypothetical protein